MDIISAWVSSSMSLPPTRVASVDNLIAHMSRDAKPAENAWLAEQEHVADDEGLKARVGVMAIVFFVSLFAASFPSISKRVKSLRIPKLVFFCGKHFGTGVILSTAFVHLLQDAFSSLHHPIVKARWNIEKWTGLIILCSLLSIFVVEYISTSYVDRLQSYDSEPSSPDASLPSTPSLEQPESPAHIHKITITDIPAEGTPREPEPTESSPLMGPLDDRRAQPFSYDSHSHSHAHAEDPRQQSRHHAHSHAISRFFAGHHRHESRGRHEEHHDRSPRIAAAPVLYAQSLERDAERASLHNHSHNNGHCGHRHDEDSEDEDSLLRGEEGSHSATAKIGKRRQLVGILVLQMGIMLHSLVIGLTLAITSGSEFTSLVVAIAFHQLFEGLSLGIRISGLPTSNPHRSDREDTKSFSPLKVTLMFLFAITTPIGILIGLLSFAQSGDQARMKLTQGLMCAISAGLLIYAACVEMLAGDFVMDSTLWRSPVWKQALAIMSLLLGAIAMAAIGWH